MANTPRRPTDPMKAAEALFKPAAPKPVPARAPGPSAPRVVREQVTLRIDRDVLEHYQADGPGWQDRINAALRDAAGLGTSAKEEGKRPEDLDASNDG
jgi:uncharacterized protein (DUF4415 family)